MKTTIIILIILSLLSCNTNNSKKEDNTEVTTSIEKVSELKNTIEESKDIVEVALYDESAPLEIRLCQLYDIAEANDSGEKLPAFTELLTQNLNNKSLYNDSLVFLSEKIRIIKLDNLKFYSYDDMTGGSMRYIKSYMQYLGEDGDVYYIELEDRGTINFAYEFRDNAKKMILLISHLKCGNSCCTAYLRVFERTANTYLQTAELFPQKGSELYERYFDKEEGLNGYMDQGMLGIHKYTAGVITYNFENIEFDTKTNLLSYDEYHTNDEGEAVPTGKRIEFKLTRDQ